MTSNQTALDGQRSGGAAGNLPEDMSRIMEMTTRAFQVRADKINEEERSVESAIATSNPVLVYDWRSGPIYEILVQKGRVSDADQVVMLDSHFRWGIGDVLGSIRSIRQAGEETIGKLFFARTEEAEKAWGLVRDGHLTDISAGYRVLEYTDIEPGASAVVGGKTYRNDFKIRLRISTKWKLREGSLVAIGADEASKIKRKLHPTGEERTVDMEPEEKNNTTQTTEVQPANQRSAATPPAQPAPPRVNADEVRSAERSRIADIMKMGQDFDMREEADAAVRGDTTPDQFRQQVLEKINRAADSGDPIDAGSANIGASEREMADYSLSRAMQAQLSGDWRKAGFERECSIAVAERMGDSPQGFFVPPEFWKFRSADIARFSQRAVSSTSEPELVGTDHLASSFIGLLRNKAKIVELGAVVLSGLRGNVDIPRQNGAVTVGWNAEGSGQAESDPTFDKVTMSPETLSGSTRMTRQMMLQANPSIEALVLMDLIAQIALGLDAAAISGTGAGNEPTGIINQTGIGVVDGTALDFAKGVEFETDVLEANADIGRMAFLARASVSGLLKTREKGSAGYPVYLIENNRMNGYPVEVSNQVPANHLLFGVWNQIIIGLWGALDILVDPYTAGQGGSLIIRALQTADVAVRHPEAFSIATAVS